MKKHSIFKISVIISVITILLVNTFSLPLSVLAASGSFGGGNSYGTSLSYTGASTTVSLVGGYSGTASVSATAYYYEPNNPGNTSSGSNYASNSSSAGGVNASVSLKASNPVCTIGYTASSTHSGSASNQAGMSFTFSVPDKK